MLANVSSSYFALNGTGGIIFWSCVLVILIVAAFFLIMRMKQGLQSKDLKTDGSAVMGFSLSDLRQMHRDGLMTDEEFVKAKGKIVAAAKRAENDAGEPRADEPEWTEP